ncbi:hypothetical protein K2173_005347 [Erythroxylum novogranatense]|uniref:Protein kinase domain-containing protein n=1 Tax=Erythroxylum novogranatense TaxID=1862640 RepID=A0AAV8TRY2_9ROSI|nr:hypothetical protein K2173_005347 [Erythroxylum novogranatense]
MVFPTAATMSNRYVYESSLIISVLGSMLPLVFSQLTASQNSTMFSIFLNSTASPWGVTKEPNPCSWKGVNCSSNGRNIIQLSLSGFALSSSDFLPAICKIESLQYLDLSNNMLSTIPDEFMNGCGRIDGLRMLNFSRNKLHGPLPILLLNALKSLNLSGNSLTGPVPVKLGKSMVLEELQLSLNHFQGTVPPEIGNYKNLILVDLSTNNLSGSIPHAMGSLRKLQILILSQNNLSGEIPAIFSSIPNLSRFAANQNKFNGTIPSGITTFLRILDLSYNKLRGPIPSDFLSQSNLHSVDLSYNLLDGSIPTNVSSNLFRLRLGSNKLNGAIPSFASLQNLTYLELDNNSLTKVVPVDLGSCEKLALLNLAYNKLTGPLPVTLGKLGNLEVLKLQTNGLVGEIPQAIALLSKLSILNVSWNALTGSIPSSISNLRRLTRLNLQGNNLTGLIPSNIDEMDNLLELQLGQNKLGGVIPKMPENLQIALNLSSNIFEGTIPDTLSSLRDLEVLDLSNNRFSGQIPNFLVGFGSLTQLILSNNQLSGIIPNFKRYVSLIADGNPGLIPSPPPKEAPTKETTPESRKKSKSLASAAILAFVAGVLTVGVVAILVFSLSRRFIKIVDQQSISGEDLPTPLVIQGNLLTPNRIHRSNINFTKAMEAVADLQNVFLRNRFSTYYKSTMPSGASYFVKKLNWSDKIFQLGSHDKFERELEVLGKLSNSNIMIPLAYVLTVDSAYLFYEYAQEGTLHDILHRKSGDVLDWPSRYSIAVGIARALSFLHGSTSSPIILLDLSSKSILLKSLKEPLVGDIELCKLIDPSKSTGSLSTVAGSVGYVPQYAYTMRVTTAGNVYSFGVILLELLTGKPAVNRWDRILDLTVNTTSLAVRGQMLAILKIAVSCVCFSPEARPKMKSVLRMLLTAS